MSKRKPVRIMVSVPQEIDLHALAKSMENNWNIRVIKIEPTKPNLLENKS